MIAWDRVDELRGEVGEEGFAEIAQLFLDEADAAVGKLQGDLSNEDLEKVLHFLKGCALNLGFAELARHCQVGEHLAMEHKFEDINLPIVSTSYQTARAEFIAKSNVALAG